MYIAKSYHYTKVCKKMEIGKNKKKKKETNFF